MSRRKREAFTLVELLVVMTIIILLISILVPGLANAFDTAETAICQAGLRNINLAMDMYHLEYRQMYPGHRVAEPTGTTDDSGVKWWATDLFEFGMAPDAFRCPTLKKDKERIDFVHRWTWHFNMGDLGYGYNAYFLGPYWYDVDANWQVQWMKKTRVKSPIDLLVFAESNPPWAMSLWAPASQRNAGYYEGVNDLRHDKGGWVVFADGHMELRRSETINANIDWWLDRNILEFWDPFQRFERIP